MEKLAFLGDIHGETALLRRTLRDIEQYHPEVTALIQVGDFGWYSSTRRDFASVEPHIPVYWIDGNHEEFPLIWDITTPTEVLSNITYVPRGTVMELGGRKIGFMGGAASVDKNIRLIRNMEWYESEVITPEDVAKMDGIDTVDIFVTHTPPQITIDERMDNSELTRYFGLPNDWRDPSAQYVNDLWERFGKPFLVCGHMHRTLTDQDGKVRILNIGELIVV